jgi:tRNA acetyltransferase TAN1
VTVLEDFNLLISTSRGCENDACSEFWYLLREIGDKHPVVEKSDISGLIVAKTFMDPFKVIEDLRKMLKERSCEFRYTLKVILIEVVVRSRIEEMKDACLKLSVKILENETFRITVEKRHSSLSTKEIIETVAEEINRKVDLENPDWIVIVEVLGGLTGVSVIRPKNLLSVVKEKSD